MEHLLHYTWKHKIFPLHELHTVDGKLLEIVHPGLYNTHAGPDFKGAKIKIDGTEWVGDVELHLKTSDWFRHHHDTDPAYEHIILHVATEVDMPLYYPNGQPIPQLQLSIPDYVMENYDTLSHADANPPCRDVVGTLSTFLIHNWMTSLTLERFEERATQIMQRRQDLNMDWEGTLFVTIARNFGFGVNGDAFEKWSRSIPMNAVGKHRDSLFQIEAFFFGQAGLLDGVGSKVEGLGSRGEGAIRNPDDLLEDEYFQNLKKEYQYLRHKFSLTPIEASSWKFLRLRPQNFPHIRIAQLAMLYYEQHVNLSRLLNAETMEEMQSLLVTHVSDYWLTHYTFGGKATRPIEKTLSPASLSLILINSVAPMLFAYGKYKSDSDLCQRAFTLWQDIKPENNVIIRNWASAGVVCENAADSQALLQLHRAYCQKRDCLRCKFGYEYLRRTPGFLRENE